MKIDKECPICGGSMKCESFYEPRWLEEEYHTCTSSADEKGRHGHYYYEYAYGGSRWTIGGQEFIGSYTNTPEEWKTLQAQIDKAIDEERKKNGIDGSVPAEVRPGDTSSGSSKPARQ